MPDSSTVYEVMISELPAASQANASDQLEANQSGTSRSITVDQVATHVANSDQIADVIADAIEGGIDAAPTATVVADLAALKALTARPLSVITQRRITAGDQGGGTWVFIAGNQSAHVTEDPLSGVWAAPDSAATGASGAWQRQVEGNAFNVAWWGALGDYNGTTGTDNGPAINAALVHARRVGGGDVLLPLWPFATIVTRTRYFTSQTININDNCRLMGAGGASVRVATIEIVGALTLSPVVLMAALGAGPSAGAHNFLITRAGIVHDTVLATHNIPAGSVGFKIQGTHYSHVERVTVVYSAIAFHVDVSGVGIMLRECFGAICSQAYVLWTQGPMLTLDNCSFGMSGIDVATEAYLRIDLTLPGPQGAGTGADTLNVIRSQFNNSGPTNISDVTAFLDLINYRDNNGLLNFTNCHIEGMASGGSVIAADAGSTAIRSISFSQTSISAFGAAGIDNFFNFNAAAISRRFSFANGSTTTFIMNLPAASLSEYNLTNCYISGGLSCAGASQVVIHGCHVSGTVNFSGNYATFALTGNSFVTSASAFTDTSTGNKYWAGNASSTNTPTIPEWFNGVVKFPEFGDCGGAVAPHTGTVAKTTLKTVTIPAKSLGANGYLEVDTLWSEITSNANIKTLHVDFGGVAYVNLNLSTQMSYKHHTIIFNQNNVAVQKGQQLGLGGGGWGGGVVAAVSGAVNTDADANVVIAATLANAADSITLAGFAVKAHYRP